MEPAQWIAIYLPLFVLFFVILPAQRRRQMIVRRKKKGNQAMTNELLSTLVGRNARLSTGSLGTAVTGRIQSVHDNWIEVETRKDTVLLNAEYVVDIRLK